LALTPNQSPLKNYHSNHKNPYICPLKPKTPKPLKYLSFSILTLVLLVSACGGKKQAEENNSTTFTNKKDILIGFYNVENLFDIYDAPNKEDGEFLPDGRYEWNSSKYVKKLDNLARVISSMGQNGPDLLGIAEVENREVMEDLTQLTELKGRNYAIVHEESADMRGIDVGLIYDPAVFQYEDHKAFEVDFPEEPGYTSRPILVVEGKVNGEVLFVVVNHWPSRRGGQEESEIRRLNAARKVKEVISDIESGHEGYNFVIMGDLNDDPFNKSVAEVLGADNNPANPNYFNPMYDMHEPDSVGTLTYRGKWNLFDQILVSNELMDETGKLKYISKSAEVHRPEFMQVGGDGPAKDMPRRAIYRDEFQDNGFSDHFPVFLRLSVKN
jgi:predicted extracellular nuclease